MGNFFSLVIVKLWEKRDIELKRYAFETTKCFIN